MPSVILRTLFRFYAMEYGKSLIELASVIQSPTCDNLRKLTIKIGNSNIIKRSLVSVEFTTDERSLGSEGFTTVEKVDKQFFATLVQNCRLHSFAWYRTLHIDNYFTESLVIGARI